MDGVTVGEQVVCSFILPCGSCYNCVRGRDDFSETFFTKIRLEGALSGGEQQTLSIGRTLMGDPPLLLLDEPVEGLAPIVVQELGRQIRHLKSMGLTILFSEQNLRFAAQISDRAYVIEKGRIRYHGSIDGLEHNSEVQKNYLMI